MNPEEIVTTVSSIDIIKELTPIISIVVVGITALLSSYLTGRAGRKATKENNTYLQKKEALDEYSQACAKFWGIIAIYPALVLSKDRESVESNVRLITECKWHILKYISSTEYGKFNDMFSDIENKALEFYKYVTQIKNDRASSKDIDNDKLAESIIDELNKFIEMTGPLSVLLLEQHRNMAQTLLSK